MFGPSTRVVNPHMKEQQRRPLAPVNNNNVDNDMGRQSQQQINNTKRAYQLAASNSFAKKKLKKGDQPTLYGTRAFDSLFDCKVCIAQSARIYRPEVVVPKRAHHDLCIKNTKNNGQGPVSELTYAIRAEQKRLFQHFSAPLQTHEKGASAHMTEEAVNNFFQAKPQSTKMASTVPTPSCDAKPLVSSVSLCGAVTKKVNNSAFIDKHQNKSAPLAMIAFAEEVADKIISPKGGLLKSHFDGITMAVPDCSDLSPHYHSIVGQKLLLVNWERTHGINMSCPDGSCRGRLVSKRTNFSKNKTLFPIFGLDGPPAWCIVMAMRCTACNRRFDANDREALLMLPEHISTTYPVEIKYALPNKSLHLNVNATEIVIDELM